MKWVAPPERPVAALAIAVPAIADPATDVDSRFLRAVAHGGVCCPEQPDASIWYATPKEAIDNARVAAKTMTASPTYQKFNQVRNALAQDSRNHGTRPMNSYETGEFVVLGVRYYAPLEVEHQLISQMGGEAGYWYGREVREQMVPVR